MEKLAFESRSASLSIFRDQFRNSRWVFRAPDVYQRVEKLPFERLWLRCLFFATSLGIP